MSDSDTLLPLTTGSIPVVQFNSSQKPFVSSASLVLLWCINAAQANFVLHFAGIQHSDGVAIGEAHHTLFDGCGITCQAKQKG